MSKPPPEPIKAEAVGVGLPHHPSHAHHEGEGGREPMGYQPPAVVGSRPPPASPGRTASPRSDPVGEPPILASLLHEYSTGAQGGGGRLPPSEPASAAPSSYDARRDTPQERRDHPWSCNDGSLEPESSDDDEPPDKTGLDDVLSSQRDILESALLMLQQLRERVEELEVQATDQRMSLGDTITRLRRRVRTLESGVGGAPQWYQEGEAQDTFMLPTRH